MLTHAYQRKPTNQKNNDISAYFIVFKVNQAARRNLQNHQSGNKNTTMHLQITTTVAQPQS